MSVSTKIQFPLYLAILVLSPLLMAPHCRAVYPNWPGSPPAPGTNPFDPGDFRDNAEFVEPKLLEARANSVIALGLASDWWVVEPCVPCNGPTCSPSIAYPDGWPNNLADRHEETGPSGDKYRCNYNFELLDAYLDTHVDPFGARNVRRHILIQLAPIFHASRTTPLYLEDSNFSSSSVSNAYYDVLDKLFEYVIDPHVNASGDPIVGIGLGNEVNYYLNECDSNGFCQPDNTANWFDYGAFVSNAVSHINNNITTETVETLSTQWYGGCGIGDTLHVNPGCETNWVQIPICIMQPRVVADVSHRAFARGRAAELA